MAKIWDIEPVSSLSGTEKIPLGRSGSRNAVCTVNQLVEKVRAAVSAAVEQAKAIAKQADTTALIVRQEAEGLKEAIKNLPDGQAVSAQVAKNTADIKELSLVAVNGMLCQIFDRPQEE